MFNHFFSAFFRGENLTTLALPDEGKGNASKRAPYEGAAKRFSMHQSMWRHDKTHRPLKGKRLTTFCASLALLQILQNVFAVHRFAQGAADWRSGPRWGIISALCPVHPFPLRGTSPQGETRDMRKKSESYTSGTISAFSPFGGWRHHLSPASGGTMDA